MKRMFGKLQRKDEEWLVTCDPHVMIRLKRLFRRVHAKQLDTVTIRDTDEVCRDLIWFCDRYPMMIGADELKHLETRAAEHDDLGADLNAMIETNYDPPEFAMAVEPRRYQRVAAAMLLRSGALLLADDVGLGKTASAICAFTDPRTLPALVVTPAHLPRQWASECEKFAPGLRVHITKKSIPYDIRENGKLPDVVVCSYHKLSSWAQTLAPMIKTIVFDEIQELRRGAASQKGAAAYKISAECTYRLGLSATPIYNYGSEIHSVISALKPEALGTREEFLREWCGARYGMGESHPVGAPAALGAHLRDQGLMLRRTRAEVGRELPPVSKTIHNVPTDAKPLKDVKSAAMELARIIVGDREDLKRGELLQASQELSWKLRMATGVAKAPHVADFVRLLVESGEKVVLYGWHRDVYEIWLERLKDLGVVMYTGSESVTQKQKAFDEFTEGTARVLIVSLRAGAGLDGLQGAARTVVFGEIDWSPGVHEQCEGRLARDGQLEAVMAYYLLSEVGSDPVVAEALGLKRSQAEAMRDPKAPLLKGTAANRAHVLAREYLRQIGKRRIRQDALQ